MSITASSALLSSGIRDVGRFRSDVRNTANPVPVSAIAAKLPAGMRRRGLDLLRRSGFAPMAEALTRHPLLAHCLAVPSAGCLALGFWAGGLPGVVVGSYFIGVGLILGRDGFAGLAGDGGHDRPSDGPIDLSLCRTGETLLPAQPIGRSQ
ncbi:hypothetical protein JL101_031460 (plasmid) [Skermanella rosea]|uniref:hypothetical protein n=1 Tax=Skermanella rosea TaxID=1817965 RepID=UPI001931972A|nr:hypothetical protein [Skermanella rosea]UEM07455.1 hypothetical protein JL101_031460 [Skermanella rosea]